MNNDTIKCGFCNEESSVESCELSNRKVNIDGKKQVFCCKQCAEQFQERKK